MGKKTVRGHDIANRFVYSLKHRNPRCFRNIGQIGKRGYDVKRINTIMGSKWSVRSYKRSFLKKTGNENRKKGNKNFAELFTLRICENRGMGSKSD